MRVGVPVTIVAACLLAGSAAWSACPPGQSNSKSNSKSNSQSRNCVDLDRVPQISQQIVAGERIAAPLKTGPVAVTTPTYTGPALGLSKTIRPTPTVGYHWAID
jgi:hypothetical protein